MGKIKRIKGKPSHKVTHKLSTSSKRQEVFKKVVVQKEDEGPIETALKKNKVASKDDIVFIKKVQAVRNDNNKQPLHPKDIESTKLTSNPSVDGRFEVESTSASNNGVSKLQASSDSGEKAVKKRRKKSKKLNTLLSKEEIERRKILANIVHKKEVTSSNWKNFVGKEMHLQSEQDPEIKKIAYTGAFRKNRKNLAMSAASKDISIDQTLTGISPAHLEIKASTSMTEMNSHMTKKLTRCIGIDCEMVGVDDDGKDNMLARVSLVNKFGECVYDKFVQPKEDVIDYRTHVSGVRPIDLKNAEPFEIVQREVAEIIHNRILVGHALRNDLKVLYLSHPKKGIRDTSKYAKFRQLNDGRTPSLKKLAAKVLDVTIQEGEHNSIIDARAAIQLYMMYRKEWEDDLRASKERRRSKYRSESKSKQK